MSPASQGGLQVERYIGTCLISKADYRYQDAHRAAHQGHQWAGLPLISMVQPRRHKQQQQQRQQQQQQQQQPAQQPQPAAQQQSPGGPRSPLSRLAIHTQGAPLILAGRYNNSRKHGGGGAGLHGGLHGGQAVGAAPATKGGPRSHRPLGPLPAAPPCGPMGPMGPMACNGKPASDSLSVASDESSGHSENSLPRIIKPRKRRKKDRKPPQLAADAPTPTSAPSPAVPTVSLKSFGGDAVAEQADEPKLHHDFDEVKEHDSADEGVLLCQCRYCDPAGLIWDVDQNCYSPFLTPQPQPQHLSSFPLFISDADSSRLFPPEPRSSPSSALGPVGARGPTDLLLRRSWSEPSPSRKLSESSDSQESDRRSPPSHQALGVSSEIVTSHYGHRDIEIKFFSLPSSAAELDCKH